MTQPLQRGCRLVHRAVDLLGRIGRGMQADALADTPGESLDLAIG